ncbi:MAG: hypothetical protein ACK41V_09025 [Acidovorax sp.]|uniref:hypothetical protein n=1 Tax=Acidovorax sp. TaxID=1872122 RepID=UPI00391C050B
MARTPKAITPPAEGPAFNETALATLDTAPAQLVAAQGAMDEVLAAGIDLGRLEALDFVTTVVNSATLAIYENVKKSKAWRLLKNPKSSDGRNFESLTEFCQVKLGKSYSRLQELASVRNAIGQDAFEQAERLGLHQRDYNAIKALPAPDQELVRRAVEEATTREQVLDVMHDLAARNVQREAALQNDLQQAKQDADFAGEQLQKERQRADEAEKKLAGKRPVMVPLDERISPFKEEIGKRQDLIEKGIAAHHEAALALEQWWTDEVTQAEGYDPQAPAPLPRSVALVALHLQDSINRLAELVGAAQHAFEERFGDDLAQARQYLMQTPEAADAAA